jgi:hypothetical protein
LLNENTHQHKKKTQTNHDKHHLSVDVTRCPAGTDDVTRTVCELHGGRVASVIGAQVCCTPPPPCPAAAGAPPPGARHRWAYADECGKRGGTPVPGWVRADLSGSEREFFLNEMVCCDVGAGGGVPMCHEVDGHEEAPGDACTRLGGTVVEEHHVGWEGHACCKRPEVCPAPAQESWDITGRPIEGESHFWATPADCRASGGAPTAGWVPPGISFESSNALMQEMTCCRAAAGGGEAAATVSSDRAPGVKLCGDLGEAFAAVPAGICERLGGKPAGYAVESASALRGNICCEKSPECDLERESSFMWTSEANCAARRGKVIPGWPELSRAYEGSEARLAKMLEHGVCCAEKEITK